MMRDSTAQKLVEEGIEELRAAHEKEIEELKEKLKKEVEELKRTHNEHIQALNRQHREEVNREKGWLEEARKTIADLRQGAVNFSNEKEVLEAKRRSLEQKVTDLQSDIGTLRRLHDKQNDQMAVLQTEQAHLLRAMEILLRRVNEK